MKKPLYLSAMLLAAFSVMHAGAYAGDAADQAKSHFQAIASGELGPLMRGYADNAQLNWVGGPLDGTYSGSGSIGALWEKFAKAQGPLKLSVDKLEESVNQNGSTVTANVLFEGKQPIKVRYVLTYRGNKIVGETWQIDPKLAVSGY